MSSSIQIIGAIIKGGWSTRTHPNLPNGVTIEKTQQIQGSFGRNFYPISYIKNRLNLLRFSSFSSFARTLCGFTDLCNRESTVSFRSPRE